MAMSTETLKELRKIRQQLIKLADAQPPLKPFENDAKSIRRAAAAVKDAILDGSN